MANSGPGSGHGLLRSCREDSCQISLLDLIGPLSAKVDSAAIQETDKEVSNYLDRHGTSNATIRSQFFHNSRSLPTSVSHYVSACDTVNLILLCGAGFFRELHRPHHRESFPTNNKKSMQP